MHIMNTEYFGIVMVPLESHNTLEQEREHFDFIRLEAIGNSLHFILNNYVEYLKERFEY